MGTHFKVVWRNRQPLTQTVDMKENSMDWNRRIKIDPAQNRHQMMMIVVVVLAVALACGLGVYFGLFMGMRLYG